MFYQLKFYKLSKSLNQNQDQQSTVGNSEKPGFVHFGPTEPDWMKTHVISTNLQTFWFNQALENQVLRNETLEVLGKRTLQRGTTEASPPFPVDKIVPETSMFGRHFDY